MTDEPLRVYVNLDDSWACCPCGQRHFYGDHAVTVEWLRIHKPHTNGLIREFITDDGMRCLSDNVPRISVGNFP